MRKQIVLLSILLYFPSHTDPVSASESGSLKAQNVKSEEIEKALLKFREVISLARTETSLQKPVQNRIDKILSAVSGIENNLYLIRLFIATTKRNANEDGAAFMMHSICDYAIFRCSWWIACSEKPGAANALSLVRQEWKPDAMNGLLFRSCELRQQHKPDITI